MVSLLVKSSWTTHNEAPTHSLTFLRADERGDAPLSRDPSRAKQDVGASGLGAPDGSPRHRVRAVGDEAGCARGGIHVGQ